MKTMSLVAPYSVYCVLLYMIPFVCKCTCISSSSGNVKLIIVECLIEDMFVLIYSGDMYLKDQSHSSMSNVKSANVIGQHHELCVKKWDGFKGSVSSVRILLYF